MNYRISPAVVESIIPSIFRPKLVRGYSIAGICLIRLEEIRPKGLPRLLGVSSENSAHRIAVEWTESDGTKKEGVYVPRRDTDSRLNSLAGGRLFPGVHHLSRFAVRDDGETVSMTVESDKPKGPLIDLKVHPSGEFPSESIFSTLAESSDFFEAGCVGYSARPNSCRLDGLQLKVPKWKVSVVDAEHVRSAFFDDTSVFPKGSIEFDHALLMRDIAHEWHSEPDKDSTEKSPQVTEQAARA